MRQDIHNLSIETLRSECHVLLAHVQVCTVFSVLAGFCTSAAEIYPGTFSAHDKYSDLQKSMY